MTKGRPNSCLKFKQIFVMAVAPLLLIFSVLFGLLTTSTRLYSQDGPPSIQLAATVPNSNNLSPDLPMILVQELPYCEMGYGSCGGQCSSDEGKKRWNCAADTLPCQHEGQHCTCEPADMCKPKKKKLVPSQ